MIVCSCNGVSSSDIVQRKLTTVNDVLQSTPNRSCGACIDDLKKLLMIPQLEVVECQELNSNDSREPTKEVSMTTDGFEQLDELFIATTLKLYSRPKLFDKKDVAHCVVFFKGSLVSFSRYTGADRVLFSTKGRASAEVKRWFVKPSLNELEKRMPSTSEKFRKLFVDDWVAKNIKIVSLCELLECAGPAISNAEQELND